jgi:hypothetical protein
MAEVRQMGAAMGKAGISNVFLVPLHPASVGTKIDEVRAR